ncbi:MAG: hypothetical protein OEV44_00565 [Spirochaetota bacterium]|nr:hypothetical protein [Spirochaetota bacterium]
MHRFNTNETYIWTFGDNFLVKCPKCCKLAYVITTDKESSPKIRFSCLNCGYTKDWKQKNPVITSYPNVDFFKEGQILIGTAVDWYFHFPLWLQTACCGKNLWAYNSEHLSWLKSYVSAKLREHSPHKNYGWSNQSLASRLPNWIKQNNHREAILTAIEKLEQTIIYT